MKIQLQVEVKPGTQAQAGTAQAVIEAAAIQIGSGSTDGEIKRSHAPVDGKPGEVYATAKFTITPDEPAKKK